MSHLYTEIAIMVLIILYAVLVLVDMVLEDDTRESIEYELWLIDLILLCAFALELALKLYAFGTKFLANGWNMFDTIVIVLTIVFAVLEKLLSSLVLLRILRLRSVLRLFRIMVIFGRFKQGTSAMKRLRTRNDKYGNLESPVERAMHILHDLSLLRTLTEKQHEGIEYVIHVLSSGQMYGPIMGQKKGSNSSNDGDHVDDETTAWLQGYMPNNIAQKSKPREAMIGESEVMEAHLAGQIPMDELVDETGPNASADLEGGQPRDIVSKLSLQQRKHAKTQSFKLRVSRMAKTSDLASQIQTMERVQRTRVDVVPVVSERQEFAAAATTNTRFAVILKMRQLTRRAVRMERMLERIDDWAFDVFEANEVSNGSPLFMITANLLELHGVIAHFHLPVDDLHRLLHKVEEGYIANPYHNNIHAADVTQTMSFFITKPFLLPYVKPLEILASLLAAAIHDYKHPGLNNAFHVAISHQLAIRYNDKSVLEAYHVAEFFALMKEPRYNALAILSNSDFRELRSLMIDMVLGTDMAHHFEETAKFKSKLLQVARNKEQGNQNHINTGEDTHMYLKMALHSSDVSNPVKPLAFAKRWADLIVEEFYAQGDNERDRGLPISSFMDRNKGNIPKLQLGFINFIVAPLFEEWARVVEEVEKECMPFLRVNIKFWERRQAREEKQRRGSVSSAASTGRARSRTSDNAAGAGAGPVRVNVRQKPSLDEQTRTQND